MSELIEKFAENHKAPGGTIHTISQKELGVTLSGIFNESEKIIIHKKVEEKYKILNIWKETGITAQLEVMDPEKENPFEWKNKIEKFDCSITSPVAFIAFTGTTVLTSKNDNSRLLPLFPKRHVLIGHVDQMVWEMKDFWEKFGTDMDEMGSNLVFATGPSRTADIEKIIVRGAHGPAIFEVILITD